MRVRLWQRARRTRSRVLHLGVLLLAHLRQPLYEGDHFPNLLVLWWGQTPACRSFGCRSSQSKTALRSAPTAPMVSRSRGGLYGRAFALECPPPLPPFHSITSSARARSVGGTLIPTVPAVSWLMTSSNFAGAWTGNSPAGSPR